MCLIIATDTSLQLENSTLFCSFDYMKFGDTKYCGSGLWQIGVPSTNEKSNVWSNNFCCKYIFSFFDILYAVWHWLLE